VSAEEQMAVDDLRCAFCLHFAEMGFEDCVQCGERMCVDQCIPGGRGTKCVSCEEEDGE